MLVSAKEDWSGGDGENEALTELLNDSYRGSLLSW